MNIITLKAGREKSLKRRHPWIFSGAVAGVSGEPLAGDTVEIRSSSGEFLAVAACNPRSNICARVWDWRKRTIDGEFFHERIADALELRARLLPGKNVLRLVHAESDALPGVVVDRYEDVVVMQLNSAGAMRWRDAIAAALIELLKPATLYERSEADVLALEA